MGKLDTTSRTKLRHSSIISLMVTFSYSTIGALLFLPASGKSYLLGSSKTARRRCAHHGRGNPVLCNSRSQSRNFVAFAVPGSSATSTAEKSKGRRGRKMSVSKRKQTSNSKRGPRTKNTDESDVLKQAPTSSETRSIGGRYISERAMLDHELLTKAEEQELGTSIQTAKNMQAAIDDLAQKKQVFKKDQKLASREEENGDSFIFRELEHENDEDLTHLSIYGGGGNGNIYPENESSMEINLLEKWERTSLLPAVWKDDNDLVSAAEQKKLNFLTESDIVEQLGLEGGREELYDLLVQGALARDKMISSNIRLVVSIAKRWAKNSGPANLAAAYAGGWDRPSLDEAIQEGILGLMQAADRFDPERGFRFSTYATFWITVHIQRCYQSATTGCIRVPANILDSKRKYTRLVRQHYAATGEAPKMEALAAEMNISLKRLNTILEATSLLPMSLDAPAIPGGFRNAKAAVLGGEPLLGDSLEDPESKPEEMVEQSFLRQSLESAMATELAPHERDIVRLRLGLDDGVTRSVNQVVELMGGGSMSANAIRNAERRAFKKLRSPQSLATYKLLTYVDLCDMDMASMRFR